MLKARIKIFSIDDKEKEITRFLYVEQSQILYIRDIKDEIEKLFFTHLQIKKHIVSISDTDGYIISDWLQASVAVGGRLNVYVCSGSCRRCKQMELEEYTYDTEEEESSALSIKVDLPPAPKKAEMVALSDLKKTGRVRPFAQSPRQRARPFQQGAKAGADASAGSKEDFHRALSAESLEDNGAAERKCKAQSAEAGAQDAQGSGFAGAKERGSLRTSEASSYASSAEEHTADGSAKRRYLVKKLSAQPIRKMQAPRSKYMKRKGSHLL